jgi:hypothetical protein
MKSVNLNDLLCASPMFCIFSDLANRCFSMFTLSGLKRQINLFMR